MSANPERGEVEVTLDGKTYVMRPSWEALVAIERAIAPRTIIQLVAQYETRALSAEEIALIVTEGIRAYGKAEKDKLLQMYSVEKVGELLYESGVNSALPACLRFLMNVSGGSKKKAEGEDPPTE
jgi:hypothetical protein